MSPAEVDEFLAAQPACRLATVSRDGPHVVPLWYYWDGTAVWLSSVVRSQRWTDLQRDNRVALVVDAGERYSELRGVEIHGRAVPVGEVPRVGKHAPELVEPELGFHRKYHDPATPVPHDGKHAFLRVSVEKLVSWDFRKMTTPS